MAQTVVVLGARNLGGAIVEHFIGLGPVGAVVNAVSAARPPGGGPFGGGPLMEADVEAFTRDTPSDALADQNQVAEAVA